MPNFAPATTKICPGYVNPFPISQNCPPPPSGLYSAAEWSKIQSQGIKGGRSKTRKYKNKKVKKAKHTRRR